MLTGMSQHAAVSETMVPDSAHPLAVRKAHERMLSDARFRSRFIRLASGTRVHAVEAGEGEPLLLLHGSSTSSLSHLPFLPSLTGIRAINLDRPGSGLSDPAPLTPLRTAAVAFMDEAADALGLDTFALAGASMGGTWALWYALARPSRVRRLALLGASPLLPGTQTPPPIRAMVTPLLGELVSRLLPPSERMVVRFMGAMGEADTIVRYPDLLASLVAAGKDPVAVKANLDELRAIATPLGFRRRMLIRADELRRINIPTLLVWGDRDPVGSVDVARAVSELLPDARLELLPAGHAPSLGHPDAVARLLTAFVLASPS
jgi:pimeloyl-ACP methyl ester carboxylesterase